MVLSSKWDQEDEDTLETAYENEQTANEYLQIIRHVHKLRLRKIFFLLLLLLLLLGFLLSLPWFRHQDQGRVLGQDLLIHRLSRAPTTTTAQYNGVFHEVFRIQLGTNSDFILSSFLKHLLIVTSLTPHTSLTSVLVNGNL